MRVKELKTRLLVCETIKTHSGATPTLGGLGIAESAALDGVTAGTVAASKAVVVDANKDVTGFRNVGVSGSVVFGAGATMDVDSAAVAATGNDTTQTATVAKMAGTITTGALTTAANATTAVVLTLPGVVAGDIVLTTLAGGTNTTSVTVNSAIATTDTITIVLRNDVLSTTALNGTVAFHYLWMKK
jgi:hypothetical protein